MVRVFVVDSHPVFRAGLRATLEASAGFEIAGEAGSPSEMLAALREIDTVQVIVMEHRRGDDTPLQLARERAAGRATDTGPTEHVLVWCTEPPDDWITAALSAGIHGFVARDASPEELCRAIEIVAEGGAVFSSGLVAGLRTVLGADAGSRCPAFPDLTERELEILELLARGYDNRRIARSLVLAEKTVRNHVSNVFAKLAVSNRAQAVARARDAGLASGTPDPGHHPAPTGT